jgi:hypothetical protein
LQAVQDMAIHRRVYGKHSRVLIKIDGRMREESHEKNSHSH